MSGTFALCTLTILIALVALALAQPPPFEIKAYNYRVIWEGGELVVIRGSVVEIALVTQEAVERVKPTVVEVHAGSLASPSIEVRLSNGTVMRGAEEVYVPVDLMSPPVLVRVIGTVNTTGRTMLVAVHLKHGQTTLEDWVLAARAEEPSYLKLWEERQNNQLLTAVALLLIVMSVILGVASIYLWRRTRKKREGVVNK